MTTDPVAQDIGHVHLNFGPDETAAEVRCPSGVLHFKVIDGDRIEVKCNHWRCTGGDSVVLHRYSIPECELLETLKFKDPAVRGRRAHTPRKEVS